MGTTFRVSQISQLEAEKEVPTGESGKPITSTTLEESSLIPPLDIYEAVNGKPYVVNQLGIDNLWKFQEANPTDKVFGNISKKVGIIEGWVQRQAKKNFSNEPEFANTLLKKVDKITRYSNIEDPVKKLDLVYKFVLDSNKQRAFKKLENSLLKGQIDSLVNLPTNILARFLPKGMK